MTKPAREIVDCVGMSDEEMIRKWKVAAAISLLADNEDSMPIFVDHVRGRVIVGRTFVRLPGDTSEFILINMATGTRKFWTSQAVQLGQPKPREMAAIREALILCPERHVSRRDLICSTSARTNWLRS
jgi:hypothetical protein